MKKLLTLAMLTAVSAALAAPGFAQAGPGKTLAEVSLTYSALRTNASVGDCGCFWANGGTMEVAVPMWRYVAAVGEFSGETANSIPGNTGAGLSLISGMGGLRLSRSMHSRFKPFVQGLFGGVHAFDSYFPSSSGSTTSASSFALAAGGGLDVRLTRRFALRPIQLDYQYMQLPNGSTNEQHDFRVSAGIVMRFAR
jgi:opacity protein-like surface antigen